MHTKNLNIATVLQVISLNWCKIGRKKDLTMFNGGSVSLVTQ